MVVAPWAGLAVVLSSAIATAGPRVATATDTPGAAEPNVSEPSILASPSWPRAPLRRHSLYLEAFGKGGLWGLGYDYQIKPWLSAGLVASFTAVDGQRTISATPYIGLYPIGRNRHRWFVDAGPQIIHVSTPSPVPEWDGTSETGFGLEASTGYEYRNRVLFRTYAMGVGGKHGVTPWFGMSLGWTL